MAATYNLTANGSTTGLQVDGNIHIGATGTFGGGTLALEMSYDNATWFAATDGNGTAATMTAADAKNMEVGECYIRLTLSGATSPDIDINISGVGATSRL